MWMSESLQSLLSSVLLAKAEDISKKQVWKPFHLCERSANTGRLITRIPVWEKPLHLYKKSIAPHSFSMFMISADVIAAWNLDAYSYSHPHLLFLADLSLWRNFYKPINAKAKHLLLLLLNHVSCEFGNQKVTLSMQKMNASSNTCHGLFLGTFIPWHLRLRTHNHIIDGARDLLQYSVRNKKPCTTNQNTGNPMK